MGRPRKNKITDPVAGATADPTEAVAATTDTGTKETATTEPEPEVVADAVVQETPPVGDAVVVSEVLITEEIPPVSNELPGTPIADPVVEPEVKEVVPGVKMITIVDSSGRTRAFPDIEDNSTNRVKLTKLLNNIGVKIVKFN